MNTAKNHYTFSPWIIIIFLTFLLFGIITIYLLNLLMNVNSGNNNFNQFLGISITSGVVITLLIFSIIHFLTNRNVPHTPEKNTELLLSAHKKFKAVFENSNDAILFTNNEGKYIEANPKSSELFEMSHEEILNHSIHDFSDPSDPEMNNAWKNFLQAGHQKGLFKLQTTGGKIKTIEYYAKANILFGYHVFILRDISSHALEENMKILEKGAIKRELKIKELKNEIEILKKHS